MSKFTSTEIEEALARCESEPIHHIGKIQPYGALIVLSADTQRIVQQISNNLADFIDLPNGDILGKPLNTVFGKQAVDEIEGLIQRTKDRLPASCCLSLSLNHVLRPMYLRAFTSGSVFVLELMPDDDFQESLSAKKMLIPVQQALMHYEGETDTHLYFERIASITRELLDFDRVMVYCFDSEWNGEVIAESKKDGVTSYLGNHFPASDIPPQARLLYTKNLLRLVIDVEAEPVIVQPGLNPATGQPLDLTYSTLRSFSPVHIEYLRNMGVQASMSISLMQNGRLWGLIACHHMERKTVPIGIQDVAAFMGGMISSKLTLLECNERLLLEITSNEIVSKLLKSITTDTEDSILEYLMLDLLSLLNATGLLIVVEGKRYTHGELPQNTDLDALLIWLESQNEADIFHCDCLTQQFPEAASFSNIASGLLATPISRDMRNCIIWFRPEKLRKIKWAGNPEKIIRADISAGLRLSPRESFESWIELWQGRCEPWTHSELAMTISLAQALNEGISQKSRLGKEVAERRQAQLARQRVENKLLENAAQYRNLADSGQALIWTSDVNRQCNYFNQPWLKFTGRSIEQEIGDAWTTGIHPDDLQRWLSTYLASFESRKNFNIEYRIRHSSGEYRWVEGQVSPRYDASGSFIGYISQCLDVSERKAAESELKIAATVFESQSGMFVADANRIILRVNHAFTLITGYSAEDVVGKSPYMLNSGHQDADFYKSMWQVVNESNVWEGELVSRRKNGETYPEYITISAVFDTNGSVVNYVATLNDISATKNRELQRIERERELHNALVREVHHRIKNNLHGVMGILRRFARRHKELTSPINEALSQVQSVAVIHGLQGSDSSRNVRLCELVKEIVASQKALWQVSIEVDIPQGWLPCWIDEVEAVPVALVLNELVSNAVKHGNHEKDISILLAGNAEHGKVWITIINSGTLFFDENSQNSPVKGTGLRLVSSLMPEDGAALSWEQHGSKVLTKLELTSPVISSEKEVLM